MQAYVIRTQNDELLLWTISAGPKCSIATYDDFSSQCWEYVRDKQGYEVVEIIITLAGEVEQ